MGTSVSRLPHFVQQDRRFGLNSNEAVAAILEHTNNAFFAALFVNHMSWVLSQTAGISVTKSWTFVPLNNGAFYLVPDVEIHESASMYFSRPGHFEGSVSLDALGLIVSFITMRDLFMADQTFSTTEAMLANYCRTRVDFPDIQSAVYGSEA